jgi:hypothetical protein
MYKCIFVILYTEIRLRIHRKIQFVFYKSADIFGLFAVSDDIELDTAVFGIIQAADHSFMVKQLARFFNVSRSLDRNYSSVREKPEI